VKDRKTEKKGNKKRKGKTGKRISKRSFLNDGRKYIL